MINLVGTLGETGGTDMAQDKILKEKDENGIIFVKFINNEDAYRENKMVVGWGSADYREWHDSWPQWR